MAYTLISPNDIAVDKPLTQQLFQDLRDNADAIPASDAGAPKIEEEAISDSGVTAGTNMIKYITTHNVTSSESEDTYIAISGTYKLQSIAWLASSSGDMEARVYIDGVQNTDLTKTKTTGGQSRGTAVDVALTRGQVVTIRAQEGGSVTGMAAGLTFGISDKSALGRGLLFSYDSTSFSPFDPWV